MESDGRTLLVTFVALACCCCKPGRQTASAPEATATAQPTTTTTTETPTTTPTPTPAPETAPCPALRPLFEMIIRSQADDDLAQAAVKRCVDSRTLEGLARAEVDALLGPGQPTSGMFASFGLQPDDVFYEVGRFATPHPGGVPNLVLDFDAAGRCTRALAIHSM